MNKFIIILALMIGSFSLFNSLETNIITIRDKKAFDIEDFTWLVGSWTGDGFDGISHETWAEPVNGTMMGMFRHVNKEGEPVFYEFMLLDENGIRLKHFSPDLTGWEERDEITNFKMIRFSKDKIEMEDLTYERISDSEIEIRLVMDEESGPHTEIFSMKKTTL